MPRFGEALATKALAVVYLERWLPLYQHTGEMGKLRMRESRELRLRPEPRFEERSLGRRIAWTNDRLRETVEPLLPGDLWGQMAFLYWLRDRHEVSAAVSGLDELAEELLVEPASWLAEVVADRIRARGGAGLAGASAVASAPWAP